HAAGFVMPPGCALPPQRVLITQIYVPSRTNEASTLRKTLPITCPQESVRQSPAPALAKKATFWGAVVGGPYSQSFGNTTLIIIAPCPPTAAGKLAVPMPWLPIWTC